MQGGGASPAFRGQDARADDRMTLRDAEQLLAGLFSAAGAEKVEPPVLQPADAFLDLLGHEVLSRTYFTTDAEGRELCLRPDFTIPVAQRHIARADGAPGFYAYCGPIFRRRADRPAGEFVQAGLESFGRPDVAAADADLLGLALESARALGLAAPRVDLGDPGLFAAFIAALDLPEAWARRLKRHFGRAEGLADDLHALTAPRPPAIALPPALAADPATARATVEGLIRLGGAAEIAGRSVVDIAERLVEQAALASGIPEAKISLLRRYLAIEGEPRRAHDALVVLAREGGLALEGPLATMAERLDRMQAKGVDLPAAQFSAAFGRSLDYYTGMVFEIRDPAHAEAGPAIGGGRYDRLLALLGAHEPVLAVGFSVWLERLPLGRGV